MSGHLSHSPCLILVGCPPLIANPSGEHGEKLKWNKHEDALKVIPNVDPKMGAVNRAMIEALQDFRAAVYPHLKPAWAQR